MAANKRRLCELGMTPPLAAELAAQITAGTGNKRRLAELGMIGANYVAGAIAPKNATAAKLCEHSFTPAMAKELVTQINT